MDRISGADRILLMLRERLLQRAAGARGSARAATVQQQTLGADASTGLDAVAALAAVEGVDDHQVGRALIQGLLSEHFGPELLNEAKFQVVVDRVHDALRQDAETGRLLARMIGETRAAATGTTQ